MGRGIDETASRNCILSCSIEWNGLFSLPRLVVD